MNKLKLFVLIITSLFIVNTIMAKESKIKYGKLLIYKGEVNSAKHPDGFGSFFQKNDKEPFLYGTFKNDTISDCTFTIQSSIKFVGKLKFEISSSVPNNYIYTLLDGKIFFTSGEKVWVTLTEPLVINQSEGKLYLAAVTRNPFKAVTTIKNIPDHFLKETWVEELPVLKNEDKCFSTCDFGRKYDNGHVYNVYRIHVDTLVRYNNNEIEKYYYNDEDKKIYCIQNSITKVYSYITSEHKERYSMDDTFNKYRLKKYYLDRISYTNPSNGTSIKASYWSNECWKGEIKHNNNTSYTGTFTISDFSNDPTIEYKTGNFIDAESKKHAWEDGIDLEAKALAEQRAKEEEQKAIEQKKQEFTEKQQKSKTYVKQHLVGHVYKGNLTWTNPQLAFTVGPYLQMALTIRFTTDTEATLTMSCNQKKSGNYGTDFMIAQMAAELNKETRFEYYYEDGYLCDDGQKYKFMDNNASILFDSTILKGVLKRIK